MDDEEKRKIEVRTAQAVMNVQKVHQDGKLRILEGVDDEAIREILAAPRTPLGSVDVLKMSDETKAVARAVSNALQSLAKEPEVETIKQINLLAAQKELFRLFEKLFAGLVGHPRRFVLEEDEIRPLMLQRMETKPKELEADSNAAAAELADFYRGNGAALFQEAKKAGGLKLVTGGRRAFSMSSVNAIRTTGLYADIQLIPDPIYPFLTGKLRLNAEPLQLALTLFHILSLSPLVHANVTTPPLVLFPSFEEHLNDSDAFTIQEQEELAISVLGQACDTQVQSLEEVIDYARSHEEKFAKAILEKKLFVPPNILPTQQLTIDEAVRHYLNGIKGYRKQEDIETLEKLPLGLLLINGVLERVVPQFHLIENASELNAQPLLCQPVLWHYFETCAQATAFKLVQAQIISEQSYQNLRAIHDDSLSWLTNIPVEALATLIEENEHRWLRDELAKSTAQLAATKNENIDATVREVKHCLDSIVQRQVKAMREIEKKYAPKKWQVAVDLGGALTLVGAATMLPVLAPTLGVAAPAIALTAAGVLGARGLLKEGAAEAVEKQQARKSMVGILATASRS